MKTKTIQSKCQGVAGKSQSVEKNIAQKNAGCENLWKKYSNQALNQSNRDELIRKYVYLVNWVVGRLPVHSLKGLDREDLVGYGTIGLIEAVDRFDITKNTNFQSFAVMRIRGSIYDHLRSSDWLTRGSRKKVKNYTAAVSKLEKDLGRYPSDKEISQELAISLEELRTIQKEAHIGIFSLDEPKDTSDDGQISMIDTISIDSPSVLDELEESELKTHLMKAIDALPEKEKTIIGLYHYKKLTFKEIATVMSFSESRASQIHARAILLLKTKMLECQS